MLSTHIDRSADEWLRWLQERYDFFNTLCFQGSLPRIPFRLTRANTFGGKLQFKRHRKPFGKEVHPDHVLVMDISHDRTDEAVEDILLHEMIHYYIEHHHLKDSSTHGRVFRQMMDDINQRFNRHITVSLKERTAEADTRSRTHYVCRVSFHDGRQGVTVTSLSRLPEINRTFLTTGDILSLEWYVSFDPFFNRFPHVRTPKVYRIAEDELSLHLHDALPLRHDGNSWYTTNKT